MDKRTKIVCTVGPATEDDEVLTEMIKAGMNVARLNFSHGDHEYHRKNIVRVRRIAAELGVPVAIMVDTKGPEIRTRLTRDDEPIYLIAKEKVIVTTRDVEGTSELISVDYEKLPDEVSPGTSIFINDGMIELSVDYVEGTEIHCTIVNGGVVTTHKGVNVPGVVMDMPMVTEQDKRDITFACEMDVDAIAASFVCDENTPLEIRELCKSLGKPKMMIISKIESALSIKNFNKILEVSDGIMVARGDLGIEIPPAQVPHVQKEIIRQCNEWYCPVITATQMLESMTHNPRPTRAEVTDVANAIYDGTDCVMLSGETAAGEYPVEAVRMMAEVCLRAEENLPERHTYHDCEGMHNVSEATSFAAVEMAGRVDATAILCPTFSGRTARIMAVLRPKLPIIASSHEDATIRRMCFTWGVTAVLTEEQAGLMLTVSDALHQARILGYVQQDDLVVITAGDPMLSPFTNAGYETATNVCMVAQAM